MSRLHLNFACWDYDRTRALADGTVRVEGVDLNYLNLPVEETFYRMARFQEFDVAEEQARAEVAEFIEKLQAYGLMKEVRD